MALFLFPPTCSARTVVSTAEWCQLRADVGWWLAERPQLVIGFARAAHEALAGAGAPVPTGAGSHAAWAPDVRAWEDTPWRRSALAFLKELRLGSAAHPSVAERLQAETVALDCTLRAGEARLGSGRPAPLGVPCSHWWWDTETDLVAEE